MNHEDYMRNNERYDSEVIIDDLCNLINKLKIMKILMIMLSE